MILISDTFIFRLCNGGELFDKIVVINNAWRVRGDWDDIIFPYDFAPENMPPHIEPHQQIVDEHIFVPTQNNYVARVAVAAGGVEYLFMGDLWTTAPDGLKSHDLQYWAPLVFDDDQSVRQRPQNVPADCPPMCNTIRMGLLPAAPVGLLFIPLA